MGKKVWDWVWGWVLQEVMEEMGEVEERTGGQDRFRL